MAEAEDVSHLIGEIYDAALTPALWPTALRLAAQFVRGPAAALFAKDASHKSGCVYYDDGGIDPYYTRLYFEKYVKLDPATTGHYFAEVEKPVSTVDLIPYDEFVETRFFQEWAQPQGLVDFVSVTLDKSATSAAMFGVFRHQRDGLVDEETRRRMRLIAPHVRRAVLIGNTIDLKATEAASFADTLDQISAGMLLIDAGGRLVHANAAGHVMLAAAELLRAEAGRLVARDPESDQALRAGIAAAAAGDAAIGSKGIAVPLSSADGQHYVAHMLPLTSGARRRAGAGYAAAVAVFVHKAAMVIPSPPEVIAKTFKLTPTELRVLLAVVEVGGVAETAQALGVSEPTIKTHLQRLFAKTGASRQAELVKIVAGFSSPLAG